MKRIKTLNRLLVLYIMLIMLTAGILTILLFFVLFLFGFSPFQIMTSILSPLVAVIVCMIIGTTLSAVISEKILNPLNQLISATAVVSTGDFSVRVRETGADNEISDLIRGFNSMAAELGSMEMFRNDFINNFSHEIKTPITSIAGFARQLENEELTPEQRKEYTGIIISESERLTKMSTNILLLSSYENRRIISDIEEFELDEQLRKCIILLEKQWTDKKLNTNIELAPVRISGNAEMLSQLWLNLLGNAIKFSEKGGLLTVKLFSEESNAVTEITDSGIGMSEDEVKHIFEKFYQSEKSRSSQGNGLGLAIAKRAAELHNGRITVDSSPGEGTRFRVHLPLTI